MPKTPGAKGLWALRERGQSPWLDFLSRDILVSGELRRLIEKDGITGVTTNPSIFEKSISSSTAYDGDIERLDGQGKSTEEIYDALTTRDVAEAADTLHGVYEASGGDDGFVSIEVSPHFAYDAASTLDSARKIFTFLGRKNVLIKVPATVVGVAAIEELLFGGINVNATLIFSLKHYEAVVGAYFRALKRRKERGLDLGVVHSVASVFVSRIDTAVDKIIDKLAAEEADPVKVANIRNLRGRASVANSCLVYHRFRELFAGSDFLGLKGSGARVQRIVWGSTSSKDPAYSDIKYVAELIGPGTANTMPLPTIDAFKDHGVVKDTLEKGLEQAKNVPASLGAMGINLEALCQQIQDDGVKAFATSFDALIASIEKKRQSFIKL